MPMVRAELVDGTRIVVGCSQSQLDELMGRLNLAIHECFQSIS